MKMSFLNPFRETTVPKATARKPQLGDRVFYLRHGSPDGTHKAEYSPAVITAVLSDQQVQLFIMNPNGVYFATVDYAFPSEPGHWSWSA